MDEDLQKSGGNYHSQNQKCDHRYTSSFHVLKLSIDCSQFSLIHGLTLVVTASKAGRNIVDNHIGEFLLVFLGTDGQIGIGEYLWFS